MTARPSRTALDKALIVFGTVAVVFLAVADAASRLAAHAADPGAIFQEFAHDRHGHFNFALDLALALRDFDIAEFLSQVERAKVWPPLHGLVLAATMLAGGIDLKLAIVPSLIGFVATVVLIWLIALRLFPDALSGAFAGAVAVAFALVSPAFRLITADIMLEGLGAALACLSIYFYLRAREEPQRNLWWRLLALTLTALFFEKFNYWLLTLVPLAVAYAMDEPARVRAILSKLRDGMGALRGELHQPLTLAALLALAAVIAILMHGPVTLTVFGSRVSLHPPGSLTTLAYALIFARIATVWWPHRAAIDAELGTALRQLVYWHALPVALSFLIPKRLAPFLWYIGPTHHHGRAYSPWRAAQAQWDGIAAGFHVAPRIAVFAAAGVVLSLVMLRRAGPPLRAVALVALIGAAVVVLHPQQQLRFITTVMPPLWILAGAGWALLFGLIAARLPRPAAAALAAAGVIALAVAQAGYKPADKAYDVAIHPKPGTASDYEVFKLYRPYIDGTQRLAVLFSTGRNAFFKWTMGEHCKCRREVEQPFGMLRLGREELRKLTESWLASTGADTIVAVVDAKPPSRYGLGHDGMTGQFDALERQTRFVKIASHTAPGVGDVTIWRRRDAPPLRP